MFTRISQTIIYLATITLLSSCGGGGTNLAEGGIGGTGISTGTITGFGSVIVNGVHFDTTGAVVMKDDDDPVTNLNDANIDQLVSIGMVITVKGTINDDGTTGTAETITFEDILEGPVVSIPDSSSFVVLGQTINVVDGVTQYACDESYTPCTFSSFSNIALDQVIEISGFRDENNEIIAGYIEIQEDTYTIGVDEFEIKGYATTVDNDHFTIGGLTIVHAYNTSSFGGQFVEAKGVFNGTDTLTASEVEIEDESFDITDADKAELEGIAITGCTTTSCDFTLGGLIVRVDSNTQYNTGSAININIGSKLEAEGRLQGGILFADDIEFK